MYVSIEEKCELINYSNEPKISALEENTGEKTRRID